MILSFIPDEEAKKAMREGRVLASLAILEPTGHITGVDFDFSQPDLELSVEAFAARFLHPVVAALQNKARTIRRKRRNPHSRACQTPKIKAFD